MRIAKGCEIGSLFFLSVVDRDTTPLSLGVGLFCASALLCLVLVGLWLRGNCGSVLFV